MIWSQEDINIIKENHGKKTLPQINELLSIKRRYTTLRSKAQRLGLFRDTSEIRLPNKSTYNLEYFKEPTIINSFLAGRIAGDGCIRLNEESKGYSFAYKVALKDEIIIDEFIKELDFKGPKTYGYGKSPHYSDRITKTVEIQLSCFNKNSEYLKQYFNLTPNKTKRLGPTNLTDKNFNLAFIIGFLDADGTISMKITKYKNKIYIYPYMTIVSASKDILNWYKNLMDEYFPYNIKGKKIPEVCFHKGDKIWRFTLTGFRASIVIDYLRQFPVPMLDRKWNNPEILAYIEQQKASQPEFFIKKPLFTEILQNNEKTSHFSEILV